MTNLNERDQSHFLSFSSDFWLSLGQFLSRRFFFSDFQPPILVFVAVCGERFFRRLRGLTMRSRSNAQFSLPWSSGGMGIDARTILKSQPQYNKTKQKALSLFMGANALIQVLWNLWKQLQDWLRVALITKISSSQLKVLYRDLPHKVITNWLEIHFIRTGQPRLRVIAAFRRAFSY